MKVKSGIHIPGGAPVKASKRHQEKPQVWILIAEYESGSEQGYTYLVLGVYDTAEKADNARDSWRREHVITEDDDWCRCDGSSGCNGSWGVTVEQMEVR